MANQPRTSKDDPNKFVDSFLQNSRLHFIGVWKERYDDLLDSLENLPQVPPANLPKGARERILFHVDMDCFFAAVAAVGHPELANQPLAICHGSGSSSGSEVSTCNYLARAAGVRRGMYLAQAKQKCPDLVSRPYEYDRYAATAEIMYRCLFEISPYVHGLSCDEAVLDVTEACFESSGGDARDRAETLAKKLRASISLRTGCNASIGIGPNRLLARVALARAKPDSFYHLTGSSVELREMLDSLPISQLPQVGPSTRKKLEAALNAELPTVRDVRERLSKPALLQLLGNKGGVLFDQMNGVDNSKWEIRERKSIATQISWGVRFDEDRQVEVFLDRIALTVSERMIKAKVKGKCVSLKLWRAVAGAPEHMRKGSVGHGICDNLIRSTNIPDATSEAMVVGKTLKGIWRAMKIPPTEVRGMGVAVSKLGDEKQNTTLMRQFLPVGKQTLYKSSSFQGINPPLSSSSSASSTNTNTCDEFFNRSPKKAKPTSSFEFRDFAAELSCCLRMAEDSCLQVVLDHEGQLPQEAITTAFQRLRELVKRGISHFLSHSPSEQERASMLKYLEGIGNRWSWCQAANESMELPVSGPLCSIAMPTLMLGQWSSILDDVLRTALL